MAKLVLFFLFSASTAVAADAVAPPVPKTVPHPTVHFGETLPDNYFWFREQPADGKSFSQGLLDYVAAENAYTSAYAQSWAALRTQLGNEIQANTGAMADLSTPTIINGYQYLQITLKDPATGKSDDYPSYVKQRPDGSDQTVLLSGPELAGDSHYFDIQIGPLSPDGIYLPYGIDKLGNRSRSLWIKNIATGETIEVRADKTDFQGYSPVVWSTDSRTLFFTYLNDLLSESGIDKYDLQTKTESTVYALDDLALLPSVQSTSSQKFILINLSYSVRTSTIKIIPADHPETPAVLFTPVDRNLMYNVDHIGDRFFIAGNKHGQDRDLYWTPDTATSIENWKKVTSQRLMKDITKMKAMNTAVVVLGVNDDTQEVLRIVHPKDGSVIDIKRDSPNGAFDFDTGQDPSGTKFLYSYRSYSELPSLREVDLETGEVTILKTSTAAPSMADYVTELKWTTARDGARVPFEIVYKKGALKPHGENPLYLYAYGNYGDRLNEAGWLDFIESGYRTLIDRGVIVVLGYPRGGGERGRSWYMGAMQHSKKNSFSDFVSIAQYLIKHKYTTSEHMVADGLSAAGLLMGNMANRDPHLFKAIVLDDPFMDMINTLSDVTIHLTTQEYGEWGDPVSSESDYKYIRSYSPYDTIAPFQKVPAHEYPDMLFFSTMDDSQVPYWEPMKVLARIRASKTDSHVQLLHMDQDGSHDGGSGQAGLDDETYRYAYVLNELGLAGATTPAVEAAGLVGVPTQRVANHLVAPARRRPVNQPGRGR